VTLPTGPETLVGRATTDTLTNKSLVDTSTAIIDATDATKRITFDAAGTTGTATTIVSSQTANRTLTLPDATDTLVGRDTVDTLTNKSLSDASTSFVSSTDISRRIEMRAVGSTGTLTTILSSPTANRTVILPDANTVLVGQDTTTLLTNKLLSDSTTFIVDAADLTKRIVFDAGGTTGTTTTIGSIQTANRTLTMPDATDTLVARNTTDTLTNKSLVDASTKIVDSVDPTKKLAFDVAGTTGVTMTLASAATTSRTLTLPNATDTLVGRSTVDTLVNKSMDIDTFSIVNGFNSRLAFEWGGIGTGTVTTLRHMTTGNRVLILPDATDTIVARNTIDTLTNKTLTAPRIEFIENVGTLTLPNTTDTLVGRNTVDTLTNKTIDTLVVNGIATLHNTRLVFRYFDLVTTDASTVFYVISRPPTNTSAIVECVASAHCTAGANINKTRGFDSTYVIKRIGGTTTAYQVSNLSAGDASYAVTHAVTVSGVDVRFQFTGIAASTIVYSARITVFYPVS